MAGMNQAYRNLIADAGAAGMAFIVLVDDLEAEIGDRINMDGEGENPAWTSASDGTIRPDQDITVVIPADTTVRGWRGFSAAEGGTAYGGKDFDEASENWEHFVNEGDFTLVASGTGVVHSVPE